mmetsp:Transcript_14993/g.34761  ORF Transcript_14993/g.34761 Transcript_14993/m.34761 type:complete len:247 (+) Transcript_14993:31-771(+)
MAKYKMEISSDPTTTPGAETDYTSASSPVNRSRFSRFECRGIGKMLTESKAFRSLVCTVFDSMDDSEDGVIDEAELYSGLLLVHLKLAKFVGPSACFPPDRKACGRLFADADRNNSGGLDRNQFHWIMGVMCAEVFLRMLVHYVFLILVVPVLASSLISFVGIPRDTYLALAIQQALSMGVFFLAIPIVWSAIDARYSGSNASEIDYSNTVGNTGSNPSESLVPSMNEEQPQRRRVKTPNEDGEIV